jgi:hypothetical protein
MTGARWRVLRPDGTTDVVDFAWIGRRSTSTAVAGWCCVRVRASGEKLAPTIVIREQTATAYVSTGHERPPERAEHPTEPVPERDLLDAILADSEDRASPTRKPSTARSRPEGAGEEVPARQVDTPTEAVLGRGLSNPQVRHLADRSRRP